MDIFKMFLGISGKASNGGLLGSLLGGQHSDTATPACSGVGDEGSFTLDVGNGEMYVQNVLSMFDFDKDGFLSKNEAKKAAANFDISVKELKEILESIGIRKETTKVPIQTLSDEIKHICVIKFKQEAFKNFFKYLDADKSGSLTMQEVMTALDAFNCPVGRRTTQRIFDEVDSNGNGEISMKEFLNFINSVRGDFD